MCTWFDRTKVPVQKCAVHLSIAQKNVAIFDPLKMDRRADGNEKNPSLMKLNVTYAYTH